MFGDPLKLNSREAKKTILARRPKDLEVKGKMEERTVCRGKSENLRG